MRRGSRRFRAKCGRRGRGRRCGPEERTPRSREWWCQSGGNGGGGDCWTILRRGIVLCGLRRWDLATFRCNPRERWAGGRGEFFGGTRASARAKLFRLVAGELRLEWARGQRNWGVRAACGVRFAAENFARVG